MQLHRQTHILAVLCLLDLLTTLWLLRYHGAAEANPLMARFLNQGVPMFILAKMVCFVLPLACIEWAWRRRPLFVRRAANLTILAYVGLYIVGVGRANSGPGPWDVRDDDPKRRIVWTQIQQAIRDKGSVPPTAGTNAG
jgi:hypothetical protein